MNSVTAKDYLQSIKIYQAGVKAGDALPDINLSANENPYGCAPEIITFITDMIHKQGLKAFSIYPQQGSPNLRNAIAKKFNLLAQNILCGNGSDELISMVAAAFLSPGDHLLHSEYGFMCYPIAARKNGAIPIAIKEDNFTLPIKNIIDAITDKTKIIMIANPNNPTGFFMDEENLRELHSQIPRHIVLMIDAAYKEYVAPEQNNGKPYDGAMALAQQAENVLVTHTFSKAHGLAGLRIGWCYGSDVIINAMNKLSEPFSVNSLAQILAMLSLECDEFIAQSVQKNANMMLYLQTELPNYGLQPLPSQGNFLLCHAGSSQNAKSIFENLKTENILLRHTVSMGLPEYLRITIGSEHENQQLIKALQHIS